MSNVTSVLKQEQQELLTQLEEYLVLGSQVSKITEEVKEMRFSKGRVCCHCNGTDVVRNGKSNGVQRYLCRSCKKSFSDLTNSATYRSKKTLDKWLRYAKCMLNGYSIRKSAEEVEINIATSFYWRHKILNCISEFLGVGSVDGVVEADEVFFAYSYKGTKPTNMPRPSRKRGKQVKKRGISKEQVCVGTALDRHGNIISDFILIILPLILVSIAMVLLIINVKKKNEKKKVLKDDTHNQKEEKKEEDYMTLGMSLGIIFGVAIGSTFTNTFGPNSLSYGICFGMLGGMIIGTTIKKK